MSASGEEKTRKGLRDHLRRAMLSERRANWALLAVSLFAVLFAGYEYGHIIPMLDSLNFPALDIATGTMRLLCLMGVCVALATAVYCAMLLTGQTLSVDETRTRKGKRKE